MSATPELHAVESTDPLAVPRRVALVRPDTRPAVRRLEERYVMTFPHLIVREVILFQVVVIALSARRDRLRRAPRGDREPDRDAESREGPVVLPRPAGAPALLSADRRRRPPAGPRRPLARRDSLRADQPHGRAALGRAAGRGPRSPSPRSRPPSSSSSAPSAAGRSSIPTLLTAAAMFAARGGEGGGRLRRALATRDASRVDHDLVRRHRDAPHRHRHLLPRPRLDVGLAVGRRPI